MEKKTSLALYGALIGDYYGSYWEFLFDKPKSKEDALRLRPKGHFYTDDTFMTLAVAKAVHSSGNAHDNLSEKAIECMREIGNRHWGSYGGSFAKWLRDPHPHPYYSWGNGASMRVSAAGLDAKSQFQASSLSYLVTSVTHDHPWGIYYADVVANLIFIAKGVEDGSKKAMISYLKKEHGALFHRIEGFDLERLHDSYAFNETSHDTVPQAIWCFLSSESFEDCLARSLYIGGDSDTLAAIACSIAAPFYGDAQVRPFVSKLPALPADLKKILKVFSKKHLC